MTRNNRFRWWMGILVGVVSTVLLGGVPHPSFGQGQASLYLTAGVPQGDFKQNVNRPGFGLSGFLGCGLGRTPLMFGGSLGVIVYGSESRREPFSTTIPDVTVDVVTNNNILFGHLIVQLKSNRGTFRPYLEGLFGFNYLFTETRIENPSEPGEEVASTTNFRDFTWSYGGGGGLMFKVAEHVPEEGAWKKRKLHFFVDMKVRYLFGGEAEYLKEGSIRRQGTKVTFDVSRSRTDLFSIHLGVFTEF